MITVQRSTIILLRSIVDYHLIEGVALIKARKLNKVKYCIYINKIPGRAP